MSIECHYTVTIMNPSLTFMIVFKHDDIHADKVDVYCTLHMHVHTYVMYMSIESHYTVTVIILVLLSV